MHMTLIWLWTLCLAKNVLVRKANLRGVIGYPTGTLAMRMMSWLLL